MKIACLIAAALACSVLQLAEAGRSAPQCKKCISSGDPHYTPFQGRRHRFTLMAKGEFNMLSRADGKLSLHTCQEDTSENRANKATKSLSWNKHVSIMTQGSSVGGKFQLKVLQSGAVTITNTKVAGAAGLLFSGNFKVAGVSYTGNGFKLWQHKDLGKHLMYFKDTATNTMFYMRYYFKTSRANKFGSRKLFNVVARTCGTSSIKAFNKGMLSSTKAVAKSNFNWAVSAANPKSPTQHFTSGECVGGAVNPSSIVSTLPTPTFDNACNMTSDEYNILTANATIACATDEDPAGCVFDALSLCDLDQIKDENDAIAVDTVDHKCPANSFIKTEVWPLCGVFNTDCQCNWGFKTNAANDGCVAAAPAVVHPVSQPACLCDAKHPYHCMHTNDRSCGLPVKASNSAVTCSDPAAAMTDACKCGHGTTDCRGTSYSLKFNTQPSGAIPKKAFGVQPKVALVDKDGKIVTGESKVMLKISIAGALKTDCTCTGATACSHDNDGTCFAKQDLWGVQTCPAGTTECIAKKSIVQLYRNDKKHMDADMKCRQANIFGQATTTTKTNFCSGETPCKHQGDGTCVQKASYSNNPAAPILKTKKCTAHINWKHVTPQPTKGWFFGTDDESTAMDKWCDHNCHPKYPGQPAFCPKTHCTCAVPEQNAPAAKGLVAGWKCPLSRYSDGTCLCSAGTTECGSINVPFVNGIASFSALTIGVAGKYQLKAEVTTPDLNTGSNRLQLSGVSSTFACTAAAPTKGCQAHPFWQKPNMRNASAGWFYTDSTICDSGYDATGACNSAPTVVYAMDKWCKANRCLPHTLVMVGKQSACVNDAKIRQVVNSNDIVDAFGVVCKSKSVDGCGVCDGDGSSCTLVSNEVATVTGEKLDVVYNVSLDGCSLDAPCKHLNDGTCVPKVFRIAGGWKYAYFDHDAKDQSYLKYGNWHQEGAWELELAIKDSRNSAYCSAGTVDTTPRVQVCTGLAEKKSEIFKKALVIESAGLTGAKKNVVVAKIAKCDAHKKVEIFDCDCTKAQDVNVVKQIAALHSRGINSLFGKNFKKGKTLAAATSQSSGSCVDEASCAAKKVKCMKVPPMMRIEAVAKDAAVIDNSGTVVVNKKAAVTSVIQNTGKTSKFMKVPAGCTSFKITSGVIKFTAKIVGTIGQVSAGKIVGSSSPANLLGVCSKAAAACVSDPKCVTQFATAMACESKGSGSMIQCLEKLRPAFNGLAKSPAYTLMQRCMSNAAVVFKKPTMSFNTKITRLSWTKSLSSRRLAAVSGSSASSSASVMFTSDGQGSGQATSSTLYSAGETRTAAAGVGGSLRADDDGSTSGTTGAILGGVFGVMAVVGAVVGTAFHKKAGPFAAKSQSDTTAKPSEVDGKVGNPLSNDVVDDEQTDVL